MSSVINSIDLERRAFITRMSVLFSLILLPGCDLHDRKRPYGYIRMGPLKDYLKRETFDDQYDLYIRRDEYGLSAMSTLCTYDLTRLSRKRAGTKMIFYSTSTESTYDDQGRVLNGPTRHNLPYYRLHIDAKLMGGPRDTLYAVIGEEVTPQWRMPLK